MKTITFKKAISIIFLCSLIQSSYVSGQGFSTTAINWTLPAGGYKDAGINYSFFDLNNNAGGSTNGSQVWATTDMNADGKLDLVVYQERQSGNFNVYGLPSNPYWKVYLNTGSGFSTTAINWTLPAGGYKDAGINYSFFNLNNSAGGSTNGSQVWVTTDMNADGKPDLVVYQERQSGNFNVYGLPSNPYWKVYLNTGSGFSTTALNWTLPAGGFKDAGINYSFFGLNNNNGGSTNGSQVWATTDMNADGKPDLVVYQERVSGNFNVYGLPSNPYWKVYLNTGSGFSTTAINWTLPAGGFKDAGINYSFFDLNNNNSGSTNGSQVWSTIDINADGKPDLVIYQERVSGNYAVYGLPSNPYWKVYLNTGSGFSTTALNWTLPAGGFKDAGINYSFINLYNNAAGSSNGSQVWSTIDINGDSKLDLVVYQENQSGTFSVYGLPSNPYWKAYINTGSGFSATALNWTLPAGGFKDAGINYSFNSLYNNAGGSTNGSQVWYTIDMNGDSKLDLVVYQERQSGNFNVYGLPSNPYWKVYLNTSTVGITEFDNEFDEVKIYPNPSNGKFSIDVQNVNIEIYNLQGERIVQSSITNINSEIDLSNMTNGIYFVKIYDKDRVITKKIIKEH